MLQSSVLHAATVWDRVPPVYSVLDVYTDNITLVILAKILKIRIGIFHSAGIVVKFPLVEQVHVLSFNQLHSIPT